MVKALIFSDIHNDARALEKLMAIEADDYFAAGDLVSWARGLDKMGELMKRRARAGLRAAGQSRIGERHRGVLRALRIRQFSRRDGGDRRRAFRRTGLLDPDAFDTPGEYGEEEMAERLEKFAAWKPQVLICHSPPLDTPLDRIKEGLHAGSRAVREFIEKHQPAHFFCGHIHEAEGVGDPDGRDAGDERGEEGIFAGNLARQSLHRWQIQHARSEL